MPYLSEKIKIQGTMNDRRRKLTDDQKEKIKRLYKDGASKHSLSRDFGVSRKTIQLIVDPVANERNKTYIKENWKKYSPTKEKRAEYSRNTRHYKQELYLNGVIKAEKE